MQSTADILNQLGVKDINPGACLGGDHWATESVGVIDSFNPSTGEKIASVQMVSKQTYNQLVEQSQEAFKEWRMVPAPQRGELVRLMGEALRENKDALGSLVALEMGKIKAEGDGEVQEMIDIADFAVGLSRQLYGLTMHSERPMHRMYEQWHPYGICGIISAFNFPVAVWSWNAFLSAVCGNVNIWKPSPKTPLTAIAVQNICNRVLEQEGYKGIFNLVIGSNEEIASTFIEDKRIPLVSFTGSSAVGRHVSEVVNGRWGRTILECGGNNALIVDQSANLKLAIPAVVFGAVGTGGQRCTSTRRALVHEAVYDEFKAALVNAYKQVSTKIGNPLDSNTLMGPLIDEQAIKNYQNAINQAVASGGKVIYGNEVIDRAGNFVEPTIIEVEHNYPIVHDETFAPVLYLIKVNSLDEAISVNNEVVQGLSSAIFTDSLQNAEQFLSANGSDCGIANVNIGTSGAEIGGAFGGEKETGGGRESGSDSWKAYMRRQTNTINWSTELPLAQGIKFDI
ncbi:MAG: aldehyde dehydrogenase family protein [Saprospiraceae bacterium]|nr:aldehyde dehydrogenase family protein [Saprospiraceae bacterium]